MNMKICCKKIKVKEFPEDGCCFIHGRLLRAPKQVLYGDVIYIYIAIEVIEPKSIAGQRLQLFTLTHSNGIDFNDECLNGQVVLSEKGDSVVVDVDIQDNELLHVFSAFRNLTLNAVIPCSFFSED